MKIQSLRLNSIVFLVIEPKNQKAVKIRNFNQRIVYLILIRDIDCPNDSGARKMGFTALNEGSGAFFNSLSNSRYFKLYLIQTQIKKSIDNR